MERKTDRNSGVEEGIEGQMKVKRMGLKHVAEMSEECPRSIIPW